MPKDQNYALEVGEKGSARLILLNKLCNPFTLAFIDKMGSLNGKNALELGCGIGLMALELAKIVGEKGKVTATDISIEQLEIAKQNGVDQNIKNVEFIECSADKIKQLNQKYKLIYCRFLLAHIRNYITIVEQAISLLEEGGVLFCEEPSNVDVMFSYPESTAFSNWKLACEDQLRISGANFSVGKELYNTFKSFGLFHLRVNPIQPLMFDPDLKAQIWLGLEEIKPLLMKDGKSSDEIDKLISDLKDYAKLPGYTTGLFQYFQVSGKKPSQLTLHTLAEDEYKNDFYKIIVQTFASGLIESENITPKDAHMIAQNYFAKHEYLAKGLETKNSFFYAGHHDLLGQVGYVWYYIKENADKTKKARVALIYTKEEHRQQGFAFSMMKLIEKNITHIGINELELNVFKSNESARKLYTNLGYEVDKSIDINATRLLMIKSLNPSIEAVIEKKQSVDIQATSSGSYNFAKSMNQRLNAQDVNDLHTINEFNL